MSTTDHKMMTADEAFDSYRRLVEENDQAIPLLVYCNQDDEAIALFLAGIDSDAEGGMQGVLWQVLNVARGKFGPPKWMVFHSEGWYRPVSTREEYEEIADEPWGLSKRAAAGEDLAECLMITAVSMDESWSKVTPFVRGSSGVTWDEPMDVPAVGGIPDLLHAVMSA